MDIMEKFKSGDVVRFKCGDLGFTARNHTFYVIEQMYSSVKINDLINMVKLGLFDEEDLYKYIDINMSNGRERVRTTLDKIEKVKTVKAKIENKIEEEKIMPTKDHALFNLTMLENPTLCVSAPTFTKEVPTIIDYKIIGNKVVIVTFKDGTTEKAVCDEKDTFDLERAIEVCLLKKIFGGSKEYNNAIKIAMRQVKAVDDKKKKDAEEAEKIAKKRAKVAAYKAKKIAKKRQEQINIQCEAFLKAMKMYDAEGVDANLQTFNKEMERLNSCKDEEFVMPEDK